MAVELAGFLNLASLNEGFAATDYVWEEGPLFETESFRQRISFFLKRFVAYNDRALETTKEFRALKSSLFLLDQTRMYLLK